MHRAWAVFDNAQPHSDAQVVAVIDTHFGLSHDLDETHTRVGRHGELFAHNVAGHGLNVAATIAASRGDEFGTVGSGYQSAQLLMIDYETPTLFHGLSSFKTALESNARVINMSWIASHPLPILSEIHDQVFDSFFVHVARSALVIAAAGEDSVSVRF